MSEMTSNRNSCAPILSVSVAILAVLLAVLGWRVSVYVGQQNENLTTSIAGARQQLDAARPLDQGFNNLLQLLVQYLQATGDPNLVALMNRHGLSVQLQKPGQGQQSGTTPAAGTPATQPPAATAPATQPAAKR